MSHLSLNIRMNGKASTTDARNLGELLSRQGIQPDQRGIAVALNGEVVSRTAWGTTLLQPEDRIEIVQARAGG